MSFIQLIGDTMERYRVVFFLIKSKFDRDWHHMLPELLGPMIHNYDVMMGTIASLTIVYSKVYFGADQRKHQSSMSLAFGWGIHRWPVTRQMFPFDYVPVFNMWDQVKGWTSVLNLKDVSSDNVRNSHSKHLGYNPATILPTLYFPC